MQYYRTKFKVQHQKATSLNSSIKASVCNHFTLLQSKLRLPLIPILQGNYLCCKLCPLEGSIVLLFRLSTCCLSSKASWALEKRHHIFFFGTLYVTKNIFMECLAQSMKCRVAHRVNHCQASHQSVPVSKYCSLTHTNQILPRKLLYLKHFRSDSVSVKRWDFLIATFIHLFLSSLNSICHVVFRHGKWRRESEVVEPGWSPAPPQVSHPGCASA